MTQALQLKTEGLTYAEISDRMKVGTPTIKKLIVDALKRNSETTTELVGLIREEELAKLEALSAVEMSKVYKFKESQPFASSTAAVNAAAFAKRMTQLRDAEPAIKIDIVEVKVATRAHFDVISIILSKYIPEEVLGQIEAEVAEYEQNGKLGEMIRAAETEARKLLGDTNLSADDGDDEEETKWQPG